MSDHRVYFAQHGLAVDKTEDPQRPLSSSGIMQTANIARQLRQSNTIINNICHSGKLRAKQSAQIFAGEYPDAELIEVGYLSPDADVAVLVDKLQTDPGAGHTLYVGHLPHLDKLVSTLISGNEAGCHVHFQNSGVICLHKANAVFHIRWYLTPELSPINLPA